MNQICIVDATTEEEKKEDFYRTSPPSSPSQPLLPPVSYKEGEETRCDDGDNENKMMENYHHPLLLLPKNEEEEDRGDEKEEEENRGDEKEEEEDRGDEKEEEEEDTSITVCYYNPSQNNNIVVMVENEPLIVENDNQETAMTEITTDSPVVYRQLQPSSVKTMCIVKISKHTIFSFFLAFLILICMILECGFGIPSFKIDSNNKDIYSSKGIFFFCYYNKSYMDSTNAICTYNGIFINDSEINIKLIILMFFTLIGTYNFIIYVVIASMYILKIFKISKKTSIVLATHVILVAVVTIISPVIVITTYNHYYNDEDKISSFYEFITRNHYVGIALLEMCFLIYWAMVIRFKLKKMPY